MTDFYAVLDVQPGASAEEIKKNYRRLSKQYHPDVNPGNQAAEIRFKEISEAYRILANPKLREEYDVKKQAFAGKKESRQKEARQKQKPSAENIDLGNIHMHFEQYFGFDPKSKETNIHFTGSNQEKNKNPFDTSHIFEGFFTPKKK